MSKPCVALTLLGDPVTNKTLPNIKLYPYNFQFVLKEGGKGTRSSTIFLRENVEAKLFCVYECTLSTLYNDFGHMLFGLKLDKSVNTIKQIWNL